MAPNTVCLSKRLPELNLCSRRKDLQFKSKSSGVEIGGLRQEAAGRVDVKGLDVNSYGIALHARRIMARMLVAEQCDIEKEFLLLINSSN